MNKHLVIITLFASILSTNLSAQHPAQWSNPKAWACSKHEKSRASTSQEKAYLRKIGKIKPKQLSNKCN